eukprot:247676-Ditylum_brightwellii.AAC.1
MESQDSNPSKQIELCPRRGHTANYFAIENHSEQKDPHQRKHQRNRNERGQTDRFTSKVTTHDSTSD